MQAKLQQNAATWQARNSFISCPFNRPMNGASYQVYMHLLFESWLNFAVIIDFLYYNEQYNYPRSA